MDLINLGIRSIFIDNMVFAYFLGMCSFIKKKNGFFFKLFSFFFIGLYKLYIVLLITCVFK